MNIFKQYHKQGIKYALLWVFWVQYPLTTFALSKGIFVN